MKNKKEIIDSVANYYHKCSLYERWRDISSLFNSLQEEVDWTVRNYDYKSCAEQESQKYKEFHDFQKLIHQLGEMLNEYCSRHPEPKTRPLEQNIRLFFTYKPQ